MPPIPRQYLVIGRRRHQLQTYQSHKCPYPDPEYPDTRRHLVTRYERLLNQWARYQISTLLVTLTDLRIRDRGKVLMHTQNPAALHLGTTLGSVNPCPNAASMKTSTMQSLIREAIVVPMHAEWRSSFRISFSYQAIGAATLRGNWQAVLGRNLA